MAKNNVEAVSLFNEKLAAWTAAHPENHHNNVMLFGLMPHSVLGEAAIKPRKPVYEFSVKGITLHNAIERNVEVVVASQTYVNGTPLPQQSNFSVGEEQEDTVTLSYHMGARFGLSISASILILSGTFSGEVSFGHSSTSTLKRRKTWEGSWPITVPANASVRAHAVITRTNLTADFTIAYRVGLTAHGLNLTGGKSLEVLFPGFVPEIEATGQIEGGLGIKVDISLM